MSKTARFDLVGFDWTEKRIVKMTMRTEAVEVIVSFKVTDQVMTCLAFIVRKFILEFQPRTNTRTPGKPEILRMNQ